MPQNARSTWLPAVLVGAVAVLVRVAVVLRGGGFLGYYGYDASVYYTAAVAMTHGELPYRDFFLVHPPGLPLFLVPAALVGRLVADPAGFVTANLMCTLLGGLNAALVVVLALRLGLGKGPAVVGGLFHALWFGAVTGESAARLESLGGTLALLGLLAVLGRETLPPARAGAAGVAFALATSVKIWWVAPGAVVLLWLAVAGGRDRRWPTVGAYLAGGAVAGALVNLPFVVASGGRMWTMVVAAQLGRQSGRVPRERRLGDLAGLRQLFPETPTSGFLLPLAVIGVLAVVWFVLAATVARARLVVLLLAVQVGTLFAAPSWFSFYATYVAGPAAVAVAAASAALLRLARGRPTVVRGVARVAGGVPTAVAGTITGAIVVTGSTLLVQPLPERAELVRAAAAFRCVTSDSPMGLIAADALERSFRSGCLNWVDVTAPLMGARGASERVVPGSPNPAWSRSLARYLSSGDATLEVRPWGALGLLRAQRVQFMRSRRVVGQYRVDHAVYYTWQLYRAAPPGRQVVTDPDGAAAQPVSAALLPPSRPAPSSDGRGAG